MDRNRNQLRHGACVIQLEPKVMDVLCVLLEGRGVVISRQDLISQVWNVEFGSDDSVTRAISLLRRAFREADGARDYIETVPKRGYRIVTDDHAEHVEDLPADNLSTILQAAPIQPSIAVLAFTDMSPAGDQEHFRMALPKR